MLTAFINYYGQFHQKHNYKRISQSLGEIYLLFCSVSIGIRIGIDANMCIGIGKSIGKNTSTVAWAYVCISIYTS